MGRGFFFTMNTDIKSDVLKWMSLRKNNYKMY